MNFIKYLIREIFPLLNYYHYCISWPEHVCHKEDLENNFTKEKKEVLRQYNTKANSFQSFFESFRNINIIASIIHSITYKRRNMDNEEINLINQCRKEILEEINKILEDIDKTQNDLNEFNFLLKNDELYPKNVIMFKSCIRTTWRYRRWSLPSLSRHAITRLPPTSLSWHPSSRSAIWPLTIICCSCR